MPLHWRKLISWRVDRFLARYPLGQAAWQDDAPNGSSPPFRADVPILWIWNWLDAPAHSLIQESTLQTTLSHLRSSALGSSLLISLSASGLQSVYAQLARQDQPPQIRQFALEKAQGLALSEPFTALLLEITYEQAASVGA